MYFDCVVVDNITDLNVIGEISITISSGNCGVKDKDSLLFCHEYAFGFGIRVANTIECIVSLIS